MILSRRYLHSSLTVPAFHLTVDLMPPKMCRVCQNILWYHILKVNWCAKYVRYSQETQIVLGLNVITSLCQKLSSMKYKESLLLSWSMAVHWKSSFPDGILTSVQNSPLNGLWADTDNKPGSRTQLSLTRLMMSQANCNREELKRPPKPQFIGSMHWNSNIFNCAGWKKLMRRRKILLIGLRLPTPALSKYIAMLWLM